MLEIDIKCSSVYKQNDMIQIRGPRRPEVHMYVLPLVYVDTAVKCEMHVDLYKILFKK